MPKCLECGFESSRLQWTHFRYNCTGRFKNGTEYKKIYPDASLVDSDLAKKTAVTLENLINKYGEIEGQKKWEQYRKKQADSNTFEYKLEKYGWTKKQFDQYNKNRAVTLENLINKYGEIEGLERYEVYCKRQQYTTSIEYFIEKYGIDEGEQRWYQFCSDRGKSNDIYFIMEKYNITLDKAEKLLSERYQRPSFVSNKETKFVDDFLSNINESVYTYKNRQFCIWSKTLSSPLFYDITCSENKKIIEYNGDYWHCNPKKYSADFFVKQTNCNATEIWNRDSLKIATAKDRGFDVFTVWETDYDNNPEQVIKNILQWWKK